MRGDGALAKRTVTTDEPQEHPPRAAAGRAVAHPHQRGAGTCDQEPKGHVNEGGEPVPGAENPRRERQPRERGTELVARRRAPCPQHHDERNRKHSRKNRNATVATACALARRGATQQPTCSIRLSRCFVLALLL